MHLNVYARCYIYPRKQHHQQKKENGKIAFLF